VRVLQRVAVAVGILVIGALGFQGAVGAASEHPPHSTVGTTCSASVSIGADRSTTVDPQCDFAPGSAVAITLNGAPYATVTAPATGIMAETFAATDQHIAMNGGAPRQTQIGEANIFVASGANPAGAPNVATTLVTIPAAGSMTLAASDVAFTGPHVMALIMGSLAMLALGFLVLTFLRRRIPPASTPARARARAQ
jgi:hypothetical protein